MGFGDGCLDRVWEGFGRSDLGGGRKENREEEEEDLGGGREETKEGVVLGLWL